MNFETRVLRPRADATSSNSLATDKDGCVVCSSTMPSCPKCPSGQECNLRTRTCSSCPEYVCVESSSGSSFSTPVGGIAGGVVGGVAAILIALGLYYFLVYRKKKALSDEINLDSESYFGSQSAVNHAGVEDEVGSGEKSERPRAQKRQSSHSVGKQAQISSYDSFMRPPGYHKRGRQRDVTPKTGCNKPSNGAGNGGGSGGSGSANVDGPLGSSSIFSYAKNRRYSMETTASTTNASNILPIAYIPGVTIRATRNNTGSIYSAEESVFSDLTGIDTASIVHQQSTGPQVRSTMTAIKAQPRLVNVGKIDEDEEEDEEEDDASHSHDTSTGSAWNQSGSSAWTQSTGTAWNQSDTIPKNETQISSHSVDDTNTLADSDSDVDSDIGEIHRATSTRREREMQAETEVEVHDDESVGSFTLDIGR